VRRKIFSVTTPLPPGEALRRLSELLESEGVEIRRDGDTIRSVYMPQPLTTFDPRGHSNRNGVGINPFALLWAVEMTVTEAAGGAMVSLSVDRLWLLGLSAFQGPVMTLVILHAPLGVKVAAVAIMTTIFAVLFRWTWTLTRFEMEAQLRTSPPLSPSTCFIGATAIGRLSALAAP
jgi:hypothetical protein